HAFAQSTLAAELGVGGADEDELYAALDWLLARQGRAGARPPPPGRGHARALRRLLLLLRGPQLPAGAARLPAPRSARQAADRLRAPLRSARLPAVCLEVFEGSVHD